MHLIGSSLILSPSDLTGYLDCEHLTQLDVSVALGERTAPGLEHPELELVRRRGGCSWCWAPARGGRSAWPPARPTWSWRVRVWTRPSRSGCRPLPSRWSPVASAAGARNAVRAGLPTTI